MRILIMNGEWGDTSKADIEKLLANVAAHLNRVIREPFTGEIVVEKHNDFPITLYRTNSSGPITIRLNASDRLWSKFTYQFAHEFCHVISNYETLRYNDNNWFHETLCEVSSLYVLRSMAREWPSDPGFASWTTSKGAPYSEALEEYAANYLASSDRKLPSGVALSSWLPMKEGHLRSADVKDTRLEQQIVANLLLPLFEETPNGWNAVQCLPTSNAMLEAYLGEWRLQVDEREGAFVDKLRDALCL